MSPCRRTGEMNRKYWTLIEFVATIINLRSIPNNVVEELEVRKLHNEVS